MSQVAKSTFILASTSMLRRLSLRKTGLRVLPDRESNDRTIICLTDFCRISCKHRDRICRSICAGALYVVRRDFSDAASGESISEKVHGGGFCQAMGCSHGEAHCLARIEVSTIEFAPRAGVIDCTCDQSLT